MSLAWLKAEVVLGKLGKVAAAALLTATLGLAGCSDEPAKKPVAQGCTLNSDCDAGLVCSFQLCHQQCQQSSDCPTDQRCVQTDKVNVCQLNKEKECDFSTDCSDPLICAIDRQCRNECKGDKDCLKDQVCTNSNVCADPPEVVNGDVTPAGQGGAGGEGNVPSGGTGGAGGEPAVDCEPDADCVPEGEPCKLGTVTCDGGVRGCKVALDADDGTECGSNKVCSGGECVVCKVGDSCSDPNDADNACVTGTVTCATGPDCDFTNAKAGTGCGTDQVCDGSGTCVACKVDEACSPDGKPCKNGKLSCNKGRVCAPTTNKEAGTSCGTDKVCDSGAQCVTCVQSGACELVGNECHLGQQDCAQGPNCVDTLANAADGKSCTGAQAYNFCTAGTCLACQNGNSCIPSTNPCHKGTLNCSTQPPTCNDTTANVDDGLACGDNKSCISGQCVTNDRVLTVTSGAVADAVIDNTFTSVTVKLVDKDNKVVQGAPVAVIASPGAYGTSSATNASGNAQVTGRVGRAVGKYTFTVSAPGASPIQFEVKAIAPAAKDIFSVVNVDHLSGATPTKGPATMSRMYYQAGGVVSASDGTLYVADYCAVFSVTPAGVMTRIAGGANNACGGKASDTGQGTTVLLYGVAALALDEAHGYLYIADSYNGLVRQLNLATGDILTYAGGGGTNAKPWGDNGPADAAYINPTGLGVASNGDLYIGDSASASVRKVDYATTIITTPIPGTYAYGGGCDSNGPVKLYYCGGLGDPCSTAWNADGKLFLSGQFCGGGNSSFHGVARLENDGSFSLVAGSYGSVTPAEGGVATSAVFGSSPYLAFDKAGNLFLSARADHRVRRIEAFSTKITTVAGTGTYGYSGDYGPGNAAQVYYPTAVTLDGAGNLYFADWSNYAIRSVYGIGSATAPSGTLAIVSGGGQTVKRNQAFTALLVKVTDANNAAISGLNVKWKRAANETGSGLGADGAVTTFTKTNASGNASATGRVGLAKGDYHFEASYTDIHGKAASGSPQTFTVTAEDPAAGTIFPVVNYVHTSGLGGFPGPAVFAKLQSYSLGVVASSNGTIYSSDGCAVYATTSAGEISVFAGTPGSCGFAGDSGPANGAKLYYPEGMALDETSGWLYIADNANTRIRFVDLNTGVIDTFAGGGSVTTAPYGDGGQAVDANIGAVTDMAVGPDGKVYFADPSHYYFRVVDPATGIISRWFTPAYSGAGGAGCPSGSAAMNYPVGYSAIAFKSNGDAYMTGYICQEDGGSTYGVVMRAANGTFTRIAGTNAGAATENILATAASIPSDVSDIVLDANGNLILALNSSHKVRKIDMTTGKITTIAGDGTAGYALTSDTSVEPGAYVPGTGARLYNPFKLGIWPGNHVLIADEYTYTTRMIW